MTDLSPDRVIAAVHAALDDLLDLPLTAPDWEREALADLVRREVARLAEMARKLEGPPE